MAIEWNGYDANLTPEILAVLQRAQGMVDFPIVLRSGTRDEQTNAKVGGAKASEHLRGNAVDISLQGLSDAQRMRLTQALVASGGKRLGAYSGNTGLHLDMKDQPAPAGYAAWPMFDRSIKNMGQAPEWFRAGVSGSPTAAPPADLPLPAPATVQSASASSSTEQRPTPKLAPITEIKTEANVAPALQAALNRLTAARKARMAAQPAIVAAEPAIAAQPQINQMPAPVAAPVALVAPNPQALRPVARPALLKGTSSNALTPRIALPTGGWLRA